MLRVEWWVFASCAWCEGGGEGSKGLRGACERNGVELHGWCGYVGAYDCHIEEAGVTELSRVIGYEEFDAGLVRGSSLCGLAGRGQSGTLKRHKSKTSSAIYLECSISPRPRS